MTPHTLGLILLSPFEIILGVAILRGLWEVMVDYGTARKDFKELMGVLLLIVITISTAVGFILILPK